MFCETAADTFADPARELIFQVARSYLERQAITTTELVFDPAQHQVLLNDGARFQEILQRIALLQGQHTKRPVSERMKELTAMAEAAMQRVATLAAAQPAFASVSEAAQQGTFSGSDLDGWVRGGIAFARLLARETAWDSRAKLCLEMLESTAADGESHGMADQTLAEILRLPPAAPVLFGEKANRRHMIALCLGLAGGEMPADSHSVLRRLRSLFATQALPRSSDAIRARLIEMLNGTTALYHSEPHAEWQAVLELKQKLQELMMFAGDGDIAGSLMRRFTRFASPELLNPILARETELGRKLLFLLRLYREIEDGNARFELQGILTHYIDHRDFRTQFVGPQTGREEFGTLAAAISGAMAEVDIPEPRKSRLLEQFRTQLAGVVKPAGARSNQRGVGGPKDAVIVRGLRMPLKNWSPVGLLFGPCATTLTGKLTVGSKLSVAVEIRSSLISLDFTAEAEVLRLGDGLVAARYICADVPTQQRIKAYFAA
ncbi:MAG: hypothetical protein OJJ21_06045 [Ferrovibrio sp.]|uniref:hypothetical protein n=1 Tax=Ferrovibrio sp. TaxID=1917215 RepID=UPI002630BFF8|nr:hypothetical protein [Ferrovibrio sp.]MCW0233143.1 hypothetical protein [Ferrovibrio sp.]